MDKTLNVKSLFISDLHLGYKDCKATYLLDMLKHIQPEVLYLVGDIIDFQALKQRLFWPNSHYLVIQQLIHMQQNGCKVIYIPGNHDASVRRYANHFFAGIEIKQQVIFQSLSGKRFLVCHGDIFDGEVCLGKWQARLGDVLYDLLLFINRWYNKARRSLGLGYLSLAAYVKSRISGATQAINRYQDAALKYAKKLNLDGVICGHIHSAEIVYKHQMIYINDGDWIESCTAFVEHLDASMELIYWTEQQKTLEKVPSHILEVA
ncbi:hypothetical protein PULV_a0191 [Pseudoalteromonas ulvae UL12]|uniref:UDP-2,3-diacylglucosamine hydrolase n=1 Tax=Pseudoalteromonas ulvae TaxID=107327 RepID=A0A244CUU9_PSEDV|nr:UDP-2,3-diacylglucosamine diphosphatase [Pseudoalteromonas ulvae]MBE0362655.1 hypothetical protein [Pseudoalteromonas ulvae UL12]OUL59397.1 UDP-2,3-diacylglucosamine hydrolase [Pseudoalteromonas ulvae]